MNDLAFAHFDAIWNFFAIEPKRETLLGIIAAIKDVLTIIAGLFAIFAARRWYKEIRVKGRHEIALKALREVYNIRSQIAVARRSYRSVFFTDRPEVLRDPDKVKEFEKLAEDEQAYWRAQLDIMDGAGVTLRNESVLPTVLWSEYGKAVENLKVVLDEWTMAVSNRVESIGLFRDTIQGDYLNSGWSAILINETHLTAAYFAPAAVPEYVKTSKSYWVKLDKACETIQDILKPDIIVK